MLEPSRFPDSNAHRLPPALVNYEKVQAAKWPPDDEDLPDAPPPPPGGAGGPDNPDDANFKKGSIGLKIGIVGVALVGIAVGLFFVASKREAQKFTIDQRQAEEKRIFSLARPQALPEWRKWASQNAEFELQQEALTQLAWLKDQEAIAIAIQSLAQHDHRIRGVAAQVIARFGTPAADSAKPALLKAFQEADESDRPQLAWALVAVREQSALEAVLKVYRMGHLAKVQRIGGGTAFDPEQLALMASPDQWAKMVNDESESVRQLVATILSRSADPKFTDTLIKLVSDKDIEVAREAATGLGKIGDAKARKPLLDALSKADKDSRKKFLEALRDGIGGPGLALALGSVDRSTPEREWHQSKVIFEMLKELADPRAGDLLVQFIETKPSRHWKTEAAMRLAEVGDARAVPYLAERMRLDTVKTYGQSELDEEKVLARDDNERVFGARMLADLAVIHPDKRAAFRTQAEEAVTSWITGMPQPHANGLRFLAAAESEKALPRLRDWAFPSAKLPKEGQQPPMPQEWVVAQSALRYIGWMKDKESWPKLEQQLERRRTEGKDVTATMDALQGGGLAILGMSIRAIGVGAADGFAQWGDPRAYAPLVKYIEEKKENEQSRMQACFALGWVTPDDKAQEVAKKIQKFATKDEREQLIASCYSETLTRHPFAAANKDLIGLMSADMIPLLRNNIAQAIGFAGISEEEATLLFEKMKDPEIRVDAALALVLGGNTDIATRAVAAFADYPQSALAQLQDSYFRSFGYWSDLDFEKGRIFRWVENAEAIQRIRVHKAPMDWAAFLLAKQFDNLWFDNGPHSMTRVVLRYRLRDAALKGDAAKREGALRTLRFMREQGQLMALKDEQGDVGREAAKALFEMQNPKLVEVKVPEGKGKSGSALSTTP